MRSEYLKWLISIAALVIVGVALAACASPSNITPAPAPPRTFTATDLLIQANLLPNGWQAQGKPREYPAHTIGIRKALSGSDIDFIRFGSSGVQATVNQMIVPFRNAQDAAEGYQAHDYTGDTVGPYAITWKPVISFTYQSPLANQFRVVCGSVRNIHGGSLCTIEGQYEEFLSVTDYSSDYDPADFQRTVDDLEIIARAIDAQMARYLEKDK